LESETTSVHTFTVDQSSLLIPLAAFLLEYPVGYIIPENPPSALLPSVPLDVFQCTLPRPEKARFAHLEFYIRARRPPTSSHREPLISFSCPASLRIADDLSKWIMRRFEPRLKSCLGYGSLNIERSVRVFDRVAL
jgi:hypothetical protein